MSLNKKSHTGLMRLAMKVSKAVNIVLVLFMASATLPSTALSSGLVILYPEVRKPYAKIYQDIVEGIEEATETTTRAIATDPDRPIDYYKNDLDEIQPDAIIALGQNNLSLAQKLNLAVPLVAGGITNSENSVTGISMIPDPRVIIDKLLLLYGNVRHIHVVTNTEHRKNQLKLADNYAIKKGIKLIVHDVSTVQAAASEYRTLLAHVEQHDAIWLMRDKALNESALLAQILETAWGKKVAVFSSNPTHVRRGALFAIYPNNKKLGASLARLASGKDKPTSDSSLFPLQDVYTIVNGRTSRHLGVALGSDIRAGIDSVL